MAVASTDKVAELIAVYKADDEKIKAAAKVQRKRIKDIQAVMALGLLTDEQVAIVTEILPKPREPKADAPAETPAA